MLEEDVTAVLEAKPATSKRDWLKAIGHWLRYAKNIGEVNVDVTVGSTTAKLTKTSGYVTWGEHEIDLYRQRHPVGTMARCALELLLNTAARRGDAQLLGRQHLRDPVLTCRPHKTAKSTGQVLTVSVIPDLASMRCQPPTN